MIFLSLANVLAHTISFTGSVYPNDFMLLQNYTSYVEVTRNENNDLLVPSRSYYSCYYDFICTDLGFPYNSPVNTTDTFTIAYNDTSYKLVLHTSLLFTSSTIKFDVDIGTYDINGNVTFSNIKLNSLSYTFGEFALDENTGTRYRKFGGCSIVMPVNLYTTELGLDTGSSSPYVYTSSYSKTYNSSDNSVGFLFSNSHYTNFFTLSFSFEELISSDFLNPDIAYVDAFNRGYSEGLSAGNENGYSTGYHIGYDEGFTAGQDDFRNSDEYSYNLQQSFDSGETYGYVNGYNEGLNDVGNVAHMNTIFTGIIDIALMPVNFFLKILNFEVFGINIGGFVTGLFTITIVIILFRMFFGGSGGKSEK